MFIEQEDNEDVRGGEGAGAEVGAYSHEYQTASELFDIMTKDRNFSSIEDETLTTRDLVILYKNIDLGTKLMCNVNEFKRKQPNQYVETVVYNDDQDSDSDVSEIYSNEDLQNVVLINSERIDFLNNGSSFENVLCHKLGDLQIRTSNLSEFQHPILFNKNFIKEKLKDFNLQSNNALFDGTILPASLLDYICCKRLEENYTFYLDNIIKYVKHTIEQLKRISNGDFLTEKAKEKWREVENHVQNIEENTDKTKVLAASTSIPLHVERKTNGDNITWDDIVRSEVDVRSLSKILEKKIILEVPKLICGSYKLFSNRYEDNLVISCKKSNEFGKEKDNNSRVDVVFQLERSDSGHVISKINSIMILQTNPSLFPDEISNNSNNCLALPSVKKVSTELEAKPSNIMILENEFLKGDVTTEICTISESLSAQSLSSDFYCTSDNNNNNENKELQDNTSGSDVDISNIHKRNKFAKDDLNPFNVTSDNLRFTIQRLNQQQPLLEESSEENCSSILKKSSKSSTKVRVKSPYENNSYVMEEKKRKKLLEIRERREKRKMGVNNTINSSNKNNGKFRISNAIPRQSIKCLSYSNKKENSINTKINHFFASNFNVNESVGCDKDATGILSDHTSERFTDKSLNLDDTLTEMAYMQMENKLTDMNLHSESTVTSLESNDVGSPITILSNYLTLTAINHTPELLRGAEKINMYHPQMKNYSKNEAELFKTHARNLELKNKGSISELGDTLKTFESLECRKSIDKIYNLIENNDSKPYKKRQSKLLKDTICSNNYQGSDSGASCGHRLISAIPCSFNIDKIGIVKNVKINCQREKVQSGYNLDNCRKLINSAKSHCPVNEKESCNKKERHKSATLFENKTLHENPLKAISQLLREFDTVQKTRLKLIENRESKKLEAAQVENKISIPQISNHMSSDRKKHLITNTEKQPKDKKSRFTVKTSNNVVDKPADRLSRKKIADLIEEAKEARGEAVRGPPKLNTSRINTLAQPKKTYVQAHTEDYYSRFGRTIVTDRLQKLPVKSNISGKNMLVPTPRTKLRRSGNDASPVSSPKPPPPNLDGLKVRKSNLPGKGNNSGNKQPLFKNHNDTLAPETVKKMMQVESYVKSHYGRQPRLKKTTLLQSAHISRVPLIPTDVELSSITSSHDESSAMGDKLHVIIDSIINRPTLDALQECSESKVMEDKIDVKNTNTNKKGCKSYDSDHNVSDITNDQEHNSSEHKMQITLSYNKLISSNSKPKLNQLHNTLYHQKPVNDMQKRLRMKNLTLTPKQSMQRALLLQSGDTGSIILKSTLSANLGTCSKPLDNDLEVLSQIPTFHADWKFAHIPKQVTTIGFAFPEYCTKSTEINSSYKGIYVVTNSTSEKTSQCYKGIEDKPSVDCVDLCVSQDNCGIVIQAEASEAAETISIQNLDEEQKLQRVSNSLLVDSNELASSNSLSKKRAEFHSSSTVEDLKDPKTMVSCKDTDDIDYSTSLDMLVNLLNEITKITFDQTKSPGIDLTNILSKASMIENNTLLKARDVISMSSLHTLRKLETNLNVYSLNTPNDTEENKVKSMLSKTIMSSTPKYADIEITANVPDKQLIDTFTEMPPRLLPTTANHATHMTKSLIKILRKQSSQSFHSISQDSQSNNILNYDNNLVEIFTSDVFDVKEKESETPAEISEKSIMLVTDNNIENNEKQNSHLGTSITKSNKRKVKCFIQNTNFDQNIKMKKDILVTVYSILVFTVFAALSFPEILYRA